INSRHMGKLAEIEVGIEFTVDPRQQVEIKRRRHSDFIRIRLEQLRARFLQVCTQQKRVSRLKNTPHFGQKLQPGTPVEVADRTPQKQYKKMLVALPVRRDLLQTIEIFPLETHDTQRVNIAQLPLAHQQR